MNDREGNAATESAKSGQGTPDGVVQLYESGIDHMRAGRSLEAQLSCEQALALCQSAFKFDPGSASNFDPFERRVLTVALASSELAGVAETWRARVA